LEPVDERGGRTFPRTGEVTTNAPTVVAVVPDDGFQLSARVRGSFGSAFDAGGLLVRTSSDHWAWLCFERTATGTPTAVTVVTRGVSDTAVGRPLSESEVWLRIGRDGAAFSFQISSQGTHWETVRLFSLPTDGAVEVGVLARSPRGEGCTVTFSDIRYVALASRPSGLRRGSSSKNRSGRSLSDAQVSD